MTTISLLLLQAILYIFVSIIIIVYFYCYGYVTLDLSAVVWQNVPLVPTDSTSVQV